MKTHTIDATEKKLGRVASQAAKYLMAKDSAAYVRNTVPNVQVTIVNASKLEIADAKKKTMRYKAYSGFAGGLKETTLERMLEKKGVGEVLRIAIYGMLPKNKLRSRMIKNLAVTE
jgi:large subunit ribosomal protein L13